MKPDAEPMKLASIFDEVRKNESLSFENHVRISFLRNFTLEGIEPFLKNELYKSEIRPELQFNDAGVIHQDILNVSSTLHQFSAEIIILSLVLENFDRNSKRVGWRADWAIEQLKELFELLGKSTKALIGLNTFFEISVLESSLDKRHETGRINQFIRDFVRAHGGRYFLSDWEELVGRLGEGQTKNYRFWYMSQAPFKGEFLQAYAHDICKTVFSLKGKSKKCLVLDCDNTLWGGIVGEDGPQGIKLDPHSYPGNIYYDFQLSVLNLYERGVILAINSKNNPGDVWEVLDHHPHSLLKRSHFAAERINWNDKVKNLLELAGELNIGLDSFVFVDDNILECSYVKELLPKVTVLQVPSPIHAYPTILREGLFDNISASLEDKMRTGMYQDERSRNDIKVNSKDIESYLAQLEMIATIHELPASEIPRATQLTQKTNQFNLTTRRYSEGQVSAFCNDPDSKVFSLAVKDKFGDLGLTGVMIFFRKDGACFIDTLLLSCRVLGRHLEDVFTKFCIQRVKELWQPNIWKAEFIPTKKNSQVENFWEGLGFKVAECVEGKKYYSAESLEKFETITYINIKE